MTEAAVAVAVIAGLLLALGVVPWLLHGLRTVPAGVPVPAPAPPPAPGSRSVSVVVPARDEESTIATLLSSLPRGTAGLLEVVVVDDDSRDATAAVARSAGATVLTAPAPPPGWTGKAWACHLGADATSGDLLLFLDADTTLAPGALDGLLDLLDLLDGAGGLVSVQPFHTVVRAHEQLSAYFNVVSMLASGAFAARRADRPMAFGPCLLTSRADYERAGGHEAVRSDILDDAALALAYHRAGLPVRCFGGGAAVRMRSYPDGPAQLAAGWTKNIASGAAAAARLPSAATVVWIGAHHAIAVGAVLALVAAVTGWSPAREPAVVWATGWAIGWVVVAWQLRGLLRRVGSFRWWTWAFFPVPLLAFDVLFARSAVRTVLHRSVRWRGRRVDVGSSRRVP